MPSDTYMFLAPLPAGATYYREVHPYGPELLGGFNTDLAIEIDPTQLDPYAKALAVVSGLIRFIPHPTQATGTLVLKPDPVALKDLSFTLGSAGSLVFVYRNMDTASVRTFVLQAIQELGPIPIPVLPPGTSPDPDTQAGSFVAGNFYFSVRAGAQLGMASTTGGTGGWAGLGFEIVCVPALGDGPGAVGVGWNRLKELIDPSRLTRRIDPMAFYAAVASGTGPATLAAVHTGHVLLSLPTLRTLIEIRDEYDEPFTDPITIQESGISTTTSIPKELQGTFVPVATSPLINVSYTVTIPNMVLTELPSGSSASASPTRTMAAPSHWALQAIYMPLPTSTADEPTSWFVANTAPLPRFTPNNVVTPIRDGLEVFRQYADDMRTVGGSGKYIYLAGWDLSDNFPLKEDDTTTKVRVLMIGVATRSAEVRAMLFDQPGTTNTDTVAHINALPGNHGQAILDNEVLNYGSHHQKFLVVNGNKGTFAFCGGTDINPNRRDSPNHGAKGAFHDVHAKVEGPAVADIQRSFIDRWNNHPAKRNDPPLSPLPFIPNAGSVFVQVACTYARKKNYPFAPLGSVTPLNAFLRAISKAKKFIYIEDQYLTPYPGTGPFQFDTSKPPVQPPSAADDTVGVLNALMEALERIDYLIIVIPNHFDVPQGRFRRQQFIKGLRAADPEKKKVHVFYLAREGPHPGPGEVATEGGCPTCSGSQKYPYEIYCHSKVWIVDDICAKIGSANCNRRSYTYDSEMDLVMVDGALDNGARAFARRLRLELWGEHLNLTGARNALLEDHLLALQFWLERRDGAHIQPYDHNAETGGTPVLSGLWHTEVDPDGR